MTGPAWQRGREGEFPFVGIWRRPWGFYWSSRRLGFTFRVARGPHFKRTSEFYRDRGAE